ncbi:hypothetical protein AAJ63_gp106 [Synechococcus phage ACG-2014f]|uniref:Uncharacterized protein n=1 Tax=Synechococcus phage ACG-2014f TaxID=1493511 RepID=A0A0E3F4L8_9CAUD|nr:hypothetical protein AAJ63_gp106 [Synechococcus phage ACG-2014f]AIX21717.1 hypothetical protein Syn7803C90_106 [Synechococcus phage ACG-2014f]
MAEPEGQHQEGEERERDDLRESSRDEGVV